MSQSGDKSGWSDFQLLLAFVQNDDEAFQELVTGRLPNIRKRVLAECKRRNLPNWDVVEISEQVVLMAADKVRRNGVTNDEYGQKIFDVCITEKLNRLESNGVAPRRPYDEVTARIQFGWLPKKLQRVAESMLEDGMTPEEVGRKFDIKNEEVEEMYADALRLLALFAKYGRE